MDDRPTKRDSWDGAPKTRLPTTTRPLKPRGVDPVKVKRHSTQRQTRQRHYYQNTRSNGWQPNQERLIGRRTKTHEHEVAQTTRSWPSQGPAPLNTETNQTAPLLPKHTKEWMTAQPRETHGTAHQDSRPRGRSNHEELVQSRSSALNTETKQTAPLQQTHHQKEWTTALHREAHGTAHQNPRPGVA